MNKHINPKPTQKGWYIIKILTQDEFPSEIYSYDIYADGHWLYGDTFKSRILEIVKQVPKGTSYRDIKKEVDILNHQK